MFIYEGLGSIYPSKLSRLFILHSSFLCYSFWILNAGPRSYSASFRTALLVTTVGTPREGFLEFSSSYSGSQLMH